jgi:thioredoxin reductase
MDLKSDGFASDLSDPEGRYTLAAYCRGMGIPYEAAGWPVPLDVFVAYGRWFQERAVPELEQKTIASIEPAAGGYRVALSDGEQVLTRNVVLAVGITHFRYVPPMLAALPANAISHSAAHANPSALKGREITIVGRGASALDLAMLAHEAGARVRVVARKDTIKFHSKARHPQPVWARIRRPMSRLGAGWRNLAYAEMPLLFSFLPEAKRIRIVRDVLGPAPGYTVRPRVEGKVEILLGREIERAAYEDGKVNLTLRCADGSHETLATDHVIAATGYRVDLERLSFLAPELRGAIRTAEGAPALTRGFESSASGLFFVGLAAANTFGPLMRFAAGDEFAARRLSRLLGRRAREQAATAPITALQMAVEPH